MFEPSQMTHEDWTKMLDDERERQLQKALEACDKLGLPKEHMLTLIYETGARFMPDKHHQERKAA